MRNLITAIFVGLSLILSATVFAAEGEFGNQCAMGLAMGQHVDTDCSVSWVDSDGKTYCFGNEDAKNMFQEDAEGNLTKAQDFYTGVEN